MTAATELLDDNAADLAAYLDGMAEVVTEFDDEACVIVRAQLDQLLTQVKGAIGSVDRRLIALHAAGETVTIPGHGQAVILATHKSKTLGAKLARTLAARIADTPADPETGEMLPPALLCERTADELVDVFGLDNATQSFRATKVKERGLKAGAFREYEDGEPRVRFEAL